MYRPTLGTRIRLPSAAVNLTMSTKQIDEETLEHAHFDGVFPPNLRLVETDHKSRCCRDS